ncbi:hypothetical protein A2363_03865 [Candidatus Gottesmanbacteria bacterium RIFOXYB1_FULL_47_11]|uniref:Uncharacterized protein n=1 Tax=Candidatus Gottesmanbacteria bacterium RIFOXYB1_FULL_47_11 TaxID=1798401 RepID=A0A1F6BDZ7_9BACT|nr:MAG: hypothetical protein A2363_03865 [Candidatus Gottesmanbacteria bacterium RIFOXYB1_FULL_47_11]
MKNYEQAICNIFDLEPQHFRVVQDPNMPNKIVVQAVDNILPLALGRHEIVFDRAELEAEAKSVK